MGASTSQKPTQPPAQAHPSGVSNAAEDPFLTAGRLARSATATVAPGPQKLRLAMRKEGADRVQLAVMLMLGLYAPTVVFITLMALFTYASHFVPIAPWLFAAIGGAFCLVGSWPTVHVNVRSSKFHWIPMASSLLALSLGVFVGRLNGVFIEPWVNARYLNHYKDVVASTDPASMADAGIIEFASGTKLDVGSSVGFRAWPNRYCAAPILAEGAASGNGQAQFVGFWAVGMNCCDQRGGFACDSAADASASAGLRVSSHSLGELSGQDVDSLYHRAVHMAAANYGLQVAEPPILVAWHRDPEAVASSWLTVANIVFSVIVSVAVLTCCACQLRMVELGRLAQKD